MSEEERSETPCPVCGQHALALDEPPRIDVLGVQPYSDIVGMGDLPSGGAIGIVCLECGTHWRDKAAFDRGEPDRDRGDADVDPATMAALENEPPVGDDDDDIPVDAPGDDVDDLDDDRAT